MDYTIGIDMGGTNTVFGIVDTAGNVIARGHIPTSGPTPEVYINTLADAVANLMHAVGVRSESVRGVGIGAPCANYRTGEIEAATELPWPSPIPLARMLSQRMAMPVSVSNDANAAAMGEMRYGAARGMSDFIMLTLGSGVGSGIVSGGRLLTGHRGFAGELGHCTVRAGEGRPCGCGRRDCLQNYCSGSGVVLSARRFAGQCGIELSASLSAEDVGKAADRGEPWAVRTLEYTGEILGGACADFATFSDPEAFILFGGVSGAFSHIEPAMRRAYEAQTLFLYRDHVKILRSALPASDAAVLGAAALANL